MPDLSPEAKVRARRTILVSDVIADHADEIAAATENLPDGHVLVALVDARCHFIGVHEVSETELIARVAELEGADGSAMVFSRGIAPAHVHGRTTELADIAQKRIATIERINARKAANS
jgi:hypothetical protein